MDDIEYNNGGGGEAVAAQRQWQPAVVAAALEVVAGVFDSSGRVAAFNGSNGLEVMARGRWHSTVLIVIGNGN